MNTFNKLYNVILQSIIKQNKASRKQMLEEAFGPQQNFIYIQNFLDSLNNNKAADFICKFFCSGQIVEIDDPVIKNILTILSRNTSFNTQRAISLEDFLKQNQKYLNRAENKTDNYLDKIPQFTQKKQYSKGVVTYKVQDSPEGMNAVRKIIDAQWGQKASPWCLITRDNNGTMKRAWEYWNNYNAYPKHIAFQDGKLLAFSANKNRHMKWWDRNDHSSKELKLLDNSYMQTDSYGFTKEQQEQMAKDKVKKWMLENNLVLNQQTGKYDGSGNVYIAGSEWKDLKIPIKLGIINGSLGLNGDIAPLDFMPSLIKGNLTINHNHSIKSLEGLQNTVVEGNFELHSHSIETLAGGPKLVKGEYQGNGNTNLKTLAKFYERVQGKFEAINCPELSPEEQTFVIANYCDLVFNKETKRWDSKGDVTMWAGHISKGDLLAIPLGVINGNFELGHTDLASLHNLPTQVKGNFTLEGIWKLKNLKGMPRHIGGDVMIKYCRDLITTEDYNVETADGLVTYCNCVKLPTEEVLNNFYNRNGLKQNKVTKRFDSDKDVIVYGSDLVNGQVALPLGVVKGNFTIQPECNPPLKFLHNCPTVVGGNFDVYGSKELKSLQGCPQKIGGNFDISYCYKLKALWKGPKEVGGDYNCNWCHRLEDLQGIPEVINGNLILKNCKALRSLDDAPIIVKGKAYITGSKFIDKNQILAYKKMLKGKK